MSNFLTRAAVGALLLGTLCLTACLSVASGPLPDPFPEALAWAQGEVSGSTQEEKQGGAFLGLEGRENDSGTLDALAFDPGLRITKVVDGSVAQRAGFRVGDVLLAWDDVPVNEPETLVALLAEVKGTAQPSLEVRRGDSVFRVQIELEARTAWVGLAGSLEWRADPTRSLAGWLTGRGGVVLVTSRKDGPFPEAGIALRSVVTDIDGEPVRSARGLIRNLQAREPGETVKVRFMPPESDTAQTKRVQLFAPKRRLTEASLPVLAGYRSSPDGETSIGYLIDLYFISLFRYRREGEEREYRFLRFIRFSTGVGELTEQVR